MPRRLSVIDVDRCVGCQSCMFACARRLGEGGLAGSCGVVIRLLEEERWRQVLASLVVCFFARGVYTPEAVRRALAAVGMDRSAEDLSRLGADTLARKHAFKAREGFDPARVRIPRRILETPSPLGTLDGDFLQRASARLFRDMG